MKMAEYRLVFQSEETALHVASLCREITKETGWGNATERTGKTVSARAIVPFEEREFLEDRLEEGDTLFQWLCFQVAKECSGEAFSGICRLEDDKLKIKMRITVSTTKDGLRFRIRRNSLEKQQYWMLDWDIRPDGTFVKSELSIYREKQNEMHRRTDLDQRSNGNEK